VAQETLNPSLILDVAATSKMAGDVAATSHFRRGFAYIGGMAKERHRIADGRWPMAASTRAGLRAFGRDFAARLRATEGTARRGPVVAPSIPSGIRRSPVRWVGEGQGKAR